MHKFMYYNTDIKAKNLKLIIIFTEMIRYDV